MARYTLLCIACLIETASAYAANPDPKSLETSPEDHAKAKALVFELGSRSFVERQLASENLEKLGRRALPALREGLKSPSLEVQTRCERLIVSALDDDLKARIGCYFADKELKIKHELPGAKPFFDLLGRTEESNKLYRKIDSSNRAVLTTLGDKNEAAKFVNGRLKELYDPNRGRWDRYEAIPWTDFISLILADCFVPDDGKKKSPCIVEMLENWGFSRRRSYYYQSNLFEDQQLSRLATDRWVDTRQHVDSIGRTIFLSSDRVKASKRLLSLKAEFTQYHIAAIRYLAESGKIANAETLLPYLKVEDVDIKISVNKKEYPIQARDITLQALLFMTKQKPVDYGFTCKYPKYRPDPENFEYQAFYFDDTDGKKREAALKKWEEWYAANKPK